MVLFAYCWSWLLLMDYNYSFLVFIDSRKLIYKIIKLCDCWCSIKMPTAVFHVLLMFAHGAHSLCKAWSGVQRRYFLDSRRFALMWGEGIARQLDQWDTLHGLLETNLCVNEQCTFPRPWIAFATVHPWLSSSPHFLKTQTETSCGSKGFGESRKIIKSTK